MKTFNLAKGLTIIYRDDIWTYEKVIRRGEVDCRHQFVSETSGEAINFPKREFFDLLDQKKLEIAQVEVSKSELLVKIEEEKKARTLAGYSAKQLQDLDRKLEYVDACIKLGISRGQLDKIEELIAEVAPAIEPKYPHEIEEGRRRKPPTKWAVSDWLGEYERSQGDVHELLDRYHLRGRTPLEGQLVTWMDESITTVYMTLERKSVKDTYDHFALRVKNENARLQAEWEIRRATNPDRQDPEPLTQYVIPSESSVYRRIHEIPEFERLEARYGHDYAVREMRSVTCENFAKRPNEFVEFDFAWINTFVLDDDLLIPLGRPIIAVCKCKGTGLVTGVYLSFGRPSTFVALSCLYEAIKPKDAILDRYRGDIESPWPAEGVMQHLVADNERCNHGVVFRRMLREAYIHVIYSRVRSPWLKGGIEGWIGQSQREFQNTLPGGVKGLLDKSDYNPEKDSVLRFSVFIFLLYQWIIDVYNQQPQRRRKASPFNLWIDRIASAPARYAASPIDLALICSQSDTATLQVEGITYDYIRYNSKQLIALKEKYGRGFEVHFRYLDNDLSRIYVQIPGSHEFIEVPTYDRSYVHQGMTRTQHKVFKKAAHIKAWTPDVIDRLLRAKERIRQAVGEELERNTSTTVKKIAQQALIDSTRVIAGQTATIAGAFGPPSGAGFSGTNVTSAGIVLPDNPDDFMVQDEKITLLTADVSLS
jgi:putative transposase